LQYFHCSNTPSRQTEENTAIQKKTCFLSMPQISNPNNLWRGEITMCLHRGRVICYAPKWLVISVLRYFLVGWRPAWLGAQWQFCNIFHTTPPSLGPHRNAVFYLGDNCYAILTQSGTRHWKKWCVAVRLAWGSCFERVWFALTLVPRGTLIVGVE